MTNKIDKRSAEVFTAAPENLVLTIVKDEYLHIKIGDRNVTYVITGGVSSEDKKTDVIMARKVNPDLNVLSRSDERSLMEERDNIRRSAEKSISVFDSIIGRQ